MAFAGTPAFARVALQALLDAGHEVTLVVTQPDRPAGRGLRLRPSEVKQLALQRGLPLYQPQTLRSAEALQPLERSGARAMIVAAYGLILPAAALALFPLGCINIHASLLPRWRGAAPIQRALLAGDRETGISIMHMEASLDTGPVYVAQTIPIGGQDTAQSLHDKLAGLGGTSIVRALAGIETGELTPQPQAETGVTYAQKIGKQEAQLDWRRSAVDLDRQVRAFNPFPVAATCWGAETLRVWQARPLAEPSGAPGVVAQIADEGIVVCCGSGALCIEEAQRANGKRLAARDLLRGTPIAAGARLGAAV